MAHLPNCTKIRHPDGCLIKADSHRRRPIYALRLAALGPCAEGGRKGGIEMNPKGRFTKSITTILQLNVVKYNEIYGNLFTGPAR